MVISTTMLPLVEIFETVEGEGSAAGFPTVFVRLFGCPLRCTWCDTPYSYAPALPELTMRVDEICDRVDTFSSAHLCLTGGEPLLYREKSVELLNALAERPQLTDIHVETSGAIPLEHFLKDVTSSKVRYIMDLKLPASNEAQHMYLPNLELLRIQDELKFVIASDADFDYACDVLETHAIRAQPLFSPVWGLMEPQRLVEKMLARGLPHVKLSLQIHKVIWDPQERGV